MGETSSHTPGAPCWIDLGTRDQDAAGRFYGALFGWELQEDENPETGGYRTARLAGRPVGGVMRLPDENEAPGWLTYFCADDADAVAARAREAGGSVVMEPMSVLDYGRMAILADPAGAVFGVWQPGRNAGYEVRGETGSIVWNELNTRDLGGAREFYAKVFGWDFEEQEFQGATPGTYTTLGLGGDSFGGMLDITERVPDEVPPHWLVYFAVDDAEAIAARAGGSGGEVATGPFEIPGVGTIAVLKDPFGAVFAVLQPDPAMRPGA